MDDDEFDELIKRIPRQNEEIEKALRAIYGAGVSSSDAVDVMLAMYPLKFEKKSELSDAGEALKSAVAEIRRVRRHLNSLPAALLEHIEEDSETIAPADEEDEAPRSSHTAYRSFDDLLSAIESDLARGLRAVEQERAEHWKGRGRGPNMRARRIARVIAKLHFRLLGELPTYTVDYIDQPSSRFTRAVDGVFKAANIDANFRSPSMNAVKWLRADPERSTRF